LIANKERIIDLGLLLASAFFLGINYMTNSTDFLVYTGLFFFVLVIKYQTLIKVILHLLIIAGLALLITYPFSSSFKPFASQIGVNCAPDFLVRIGHFGPFLFEANKCQVSKMWMLLVLWGFFWLNALGFLVLVFFTNKKSEESRQLEINYWLFFLFIYSILLTMFAEFFYFKDIYPAHFRANTMFKLGYQAFMMMSIGSSVVFVYIAKVVKLSFGKIIYLLGFTLLAGLVVIYPFFSVPSYFGSQGFKTLDGNLWIKETYPSIYQIIEILNKTKKSPQQIQIVEAHGDSYTDYNIVSAQTGLATVIGWPVHEWLWRGSYEVVAPRADEVRQIYENPSLKVVKNILRKYQIKYLVLTDLEYKKYPQIKSVSSQGEAKVDSRFFQLGKIVYHQNQQYLININDL
jgi:hypothetical protein